MTMHVVYNHQCAQCQAEYIPYDAVPCPRCGLLEPERFDYIPRAVASLQVNKRQTGDYTPGAWWVSSFADHILAYLFSLMDGYAAQSPREEFISYLDDRLNKGEWGERQYLKPHLRDIALRVHEQLEHGEMAEPDSYVNYVAALSPEEAQAYGYHTPEPPEPPLLPNWGETLCAGCGQRLRTWADTKRNRCGYCHHALPPEA